MKYLLMLSLIGIFISAIAADPPRSKPNLRKALETLELLHSMKKNSNSAPTKALLQALLNAKSQKVFEQDDTDDDGLKQAEDYNGIEQDDDDDGIEQDFDDDGALMAAVQKARAQHWLISALKGLAGALLG